MNLEVDIDGITGEAVSSGSASWPLAIVAESLGKVLPLAREQPHPAVCLHAVRLSFGGTNLIAAFVTLTI
jgi:hypothetical protein